MHQIKTALLFILGTSIIASEEIAQTCQSRSYGKGKVVCVCNSTYCDIIPPLNKVNSTNYLVYTSNKAGLRFNKTQGQFNQQDCNDNATNVINVGERRYQKVHGFGGAFTDATGINIKALSIGAQQNLMRSYFGENGIEYTLGRVPMGCTDFSTKCYTYDDSSFEDPQLNNFRLAKEDLEIKIPILQEAIRLSNNTLKLIALPWTSPKWMKVIPLYVSTFTELKRKMYQPWAKYQLKFLEAYDEKNITFWGLSTGNEPTIGYLPSYIPTVAFTPASLSRWIANNLGPTIRKSKYRDIKIITLEDQRPLLPWFLDLMFMHKTTKKYVDGISVHWYFDFLSSPFVLDVTHKKYPDKFLIATESCEGQLWEKHVDLGNWKRAEDIAEGIIEYFTHWTTGWIDWNMALNLEGGPTYVRNFVDSPIIVNAAADEFYKQPMFYALGHFSKFVSPGSERVEVSQLNQYSRNIQSIGFKRPDGAIVIIILNKTDHDVNVNIVDQTRGQISLSLSAHSITSVVFW